MSAATLVCPDCGSDDLRSIERASIGYPVRITVNAEGERVPEYTGESYTVYDETEFEDEIDCRACVRIGMTAADLVVQSTEPTG